MPLLAIIFDSLIYCFWHDNLLILANLTFLILPFDTIVFLIIFQKSLSTEELTAEMANLEGLMKDLNAITQQEFEC